MPRRATLTYSSEDAPAVNSGKLYVYYCRFSGRHALTSDCNISKAPRRRTDNAIVIDTKLYQVKLYTTEGGTKLIKRKSGAIERQYRQNVGKLPVAYQSEPDGRYLYVLDDSLTSYSTAERGQADKPPVPPCILPVENNTTQLALEVDDRASRASVLKISADYVRVEITNAITHPDANEELLEFMRAILSVRLSQLSVLRGESTRHKLLLVQNTTPAQIFAKLQAANR